MEDLIVNPVNPFTGKEITDDEKYAHDQFIITSNEWDTSTNNGNQFMPSRWASVKDNLWDSKNWKFYTDEIVLTEHTFK